MAWGTTGTSVDTSKQSSSTILFALSGQTTIRQWEVVTTREIRGLTATAGKNAVPSNSSGVTNLDSTTQTRRWAHISGRTYEILAVTGSKVVKSASRKDESGQWVCTETTHNFFTTGLNTNVWGTTELDENGSAITLSTSGVSQVISKDKSSTFVFNFAGNILCQIVTTTVTEIKRVSTQAAATSLVNTNTATAMPTLVSTPSVVNGYPVAYAERVITLGTEKFASARYVNAKEGWTVTVTEKVYDKTGNWSAD